MKLGVISLGCDKATVDSERLVGSWSGHGAVVTPGHAADVILINTCGFIDAAKQESIDAMLEAAKLKQQGVKAVVAVGCLIQRYKQELQQEIPEVDLFLGFSELHHLIPELAQRGLIADPVAEHPGVRQFLGDQPHVRYLKISEGCDHTCAFCAIPLMRGKHRSEPLERLVVKRSNSKPRVPRRSILLLRISGIGVRDLGLGGPKRPICSRRCTRRPPSVVRLLYVYSAGINERLVDLMARESRIVPYIDMPIQHATDRMLERMRRPERLRTLREKLAWLRGAVPDLAIRTTCLVGFPGETEEDFRALLAFLEEAQFDRMGAFSYSPQDGTRAMQYPDDVPDEVKRDRLEEIVEVQRVISGERLERFVGREVDVLVDGLEAESGVKAGRVQWQADDVDGVPYLERGGWAQPGEFVRARITASEDYDFQAAALT
jgi:ribosomal protein S12 methylthiotransferase